MPHATVYNASPDIDWTAVRDQVAAADGVTSAAEVWQVNGLARNGLQVTPLLVQGVNPETIVKVSTIGEFLQPGSFAALTIFIARVSFWVLPIDRMRRLMSWVLAIGFPRGSQSAGGAVGGLKLLHALFDALVHRLLDLVGHAAAGVHDHELIRHAGQVVTRTMLLEHVWDFHFDPQTNVVETHMSRLRAKMDKPFSAPLLHTVRGAGYSIHAAE